MNLYLSSFLIYAIPANLMVGLTIWFTRKYPMRWSKFEYLWIYLTWLVTILLAGFVFEGLENAAEQMEVTDTFLAALFVLAGFMGGLSMLPRIFFKEYTNYRVLITSISSFIIATLFNKLVLLIFFFLL